jgi:diphosphomevalonate decarboxylase
MADMTTFNKGRPFDVQALVQIGSIKVSAPSNIALVKYWGKKGNQLPCNPSVSLTLENSRTHLLLEYRGRSFLKEDGVSLELSFEGQRNDGFYHKIKKHLDHLSEVECPYLPYFDLTLRTSNTFPHSAGIASSASSMAALAYALVLLEKQAFALEDDQTRDFKRTSHLARLGSGSASRSVQGPYCQWGQDHQNIGCDLSAIVLDEIHPHFLNLRDSILILDDQVKAVSSTQGHRLMETHPYKEARFARAHTRVTDLKSILKNGNWSEFANLVEADALELHGLMMSSTPSYILMRPQTLEAIERLKDFSLSSSCSVTFTLDAGANLHVLYPESDELQVKEFLLSQLAPLCVNQRMIHDRAGLGVRLEKDH